MHVITQPYRRPRNLAEDNYLVSLDQEFDLVTAARSSGRDIDLSEFLKAHPTGKARIWAVGLSRAALRAWAKMQPGDLVLFYGDGVIYAYGTLSALVHWPQNNDIWPSGTNWDHIYSLSEFNLIPEGRRPRYQTLRTLTNKLDVQSVGCRDLREFGLSREELVNFVLTSEPEWDLRPNDVTSRAKLHQRYGGNPRSGISSSAKTNNILVFSDPAEGRKYGYDKHEGRHEDGSYRYTGEGQDGDQSLDAPGNSALLEAESQGIPIRLFIKEKTSATYIGEYTLGEPPYRIERALDKKHTERDVIVFNLVPVSAEAPIPRPKELKSEVAESVASQTTPRPWRPPNDTTISIPASGRIESGRDITRKEFQLQSDYGNWLISQGKTVEHYPIRVDAETVIDPDLFNRTDLEIVEAKKSFARKYVREAIGQVLDYQHNLELKENIKAKPVILLPACPAQDLVVLCVKLGIKLVYRSGLTFVSPSSESN